MSDDVEIKVRFKAEGLDEIRNAIKSMAQGQGASPTDGLGDVGTNAAEAAQAIEAVSDTTDEACDHIDDLSDHVDDAVGGLGDVGHEASQAADGLSDLGDHAEDATEGLNAVGAASNRVAQDADGMTSSVNNASSSFLDLKTAFDELEGFGSTLSGISSSIVSMGSDSVHAAGEFEQLRAKLVTIQHDAGKASETFEYAKRLAASTPFDVKAVVAAAVQLEVYGQDSKELLPIVANLASAMGGDLTQAATAMGRALSGSSEGLQSLRDVFGVTTEKLKRFGAEVNSQGSVIASGATNADKLKNALVGLINTEFAGGIERQAATIEGALSNLEDEVTNTKAAIGDQLAPYVAALSKHASGVVSALGAMAPVVAIVGGAVAAVTGLGGAFISASVSAMALKAAADRLGLSLDKIKKQANAFKAANPVAAGAAAFASWATAAIIAGEAINVVLEKQIADQERIQAGMTEETRRVQTQRQMWDTLRASIEAATGAKTRFNGVTDGDGTDTDTRAIDAATAAEGASPIQIIDELNKRGVSADALKDAVSNLKKDADEAKKAYDKALKAWTDYRDKIEEKREKGGTYGGDRFRDDDAGDGYEQELRAAVDKAGKNYQIVSERYATFDSIAQKIEESNKRILAAQQAATRDQAFAKFAEGADDADLLYEATERCRKSLAQLYETATAQGLEPSIVKNDAERMRRMATLVGQDATDSDEYRVLSAISGQKDAMAQASAKLDAKRRSLVDADVAKLNDQYALDRTDRDASLADERRYYEQKLAMYEHYREATSAYTSEVLETRASWLPGEKEIWEAKLANAQKLSSEEVQCLTKLREIGQNEALQSLNAAIKPLAESADQLAGSVLADPGDVVKAYDAVIARIHDWADANAEILASSEAVKSSYDSLLKAQEKSRQSAVENRGNAAYQKLQEQASLGIASADGPVKQLAAIQESVATLQRALRVNDDIKASESARLQIQRQIKQLADQELSVKMQIQQLEEQMAKENQSLEMQLAEDELQTLQERERAGEQVLQEREAKERQIHEMRMAQIAEEGKKSLEAVRGQEQLELQAQKKIAIQRQLEENRYERQRRSHQDDSGTGTAGTSTAGVASSEPTTRSVTTRFTAGSPLMTPQEAIAKHNQWWADKVNSDPDFGTSATRDNTDAISGNTSAQRTSTQALGTLSTDAVPQVVQGLGHLTTALGLCAGAAQNFAQALSGAGGGAGADATASEVEPSLSVPSVGAEAGTTPTLPSAVGVAAEMPTPTQLGAAAIGSTTPTTTTNSKTTNNYYIDSVRSAQSVDNRAMAAMVNKLASQEQRRIRTMTGG